MKAFAVFFALFAAVTAETCYKQYDNACSSASGQPGLDQITCDAKYGNHIDEVMRELVDYANAHISRSFEYLLMQSYFGNYQQNRVGFEKLFKDLSDSKWEDAIELIKHVTTRGGVMKFKPPNGGDNSKKTYELYEVQSVARALDTEKTLAEQAFRIHKRASAREGDKHDPEISSYIEEEFVHDHAKTVRKLAGHVSDLKSLLTGQEGSLALFMFDEYLAKQ